MTSRKGIQLLALGFIFIFLPVGSWYYLKKGYNYRKGILEELNQNLGTIPNFSKKNQYGRSIDNTNLEGKVVIISFLSLVNGQTNHATMQQLHKVQDQFDKRDDIVFLTFVTIDSEEQLQTYLERLVIKENKDQWHFLQAGEDEIRQIANQIGIKTNPLNNSSVVITDIEAVVRYTYEFEDPQAIKKLIEHIANLMPLDKKKRTLRKQ